MTARRDASPSLNDPHNRWVDRTLAHSECLCPSPRKEPEKGPVSAAGIHAYVVGSVSGSGAADESSDSEAEQEGPPKLIRKVSTSGQIRCKVRNKSSSVYTSCCHSYSVLVCGLSLILSVTEASSIQML